MVGSQDTFNKLKYGSQVPKLKDKIKNVMDDLQDLFEANVHLTNPNKVIEQISICSLYSPHMNDEDSDYLSGCRWALENQHEWTIAEEDKRINRGPNWKPKTYNEVETNPVDKRKDEVRWSTDGKLKLYYSEEKNKWVPNEKELKEYIDKKKNDR